MRILIAGGDGFIGSHITAQLLETHQITIASHQPERAKRRFPSASVIGCDFSRDTDAALWLERLQGIDMVINCVGVLHTLKPETIYNIHQHTPLAMYQACQQLGIKHVVQISAIGTEKNPHIAYATSKKATDDFLMQSGLIATVIRPSYVYSNGSYGGSSLFRGLAALPFVIPLVGKGEQKFQPIHAEDLAKIISHIANHPPEHSQILYGVGPETLDLKTLLQRYRNWLGLAKGRFISTPLWVLKLMAPLGALLPWLPINPTTVGMMQDLDIAIAPAKEYDRLCAATGIKPRSITTALQQSPANVQDRWHAKLYFLSPLTRVVLAFIWILSGLVSLLNPSASYNLLAAAGFNPLTHSYLLTISANFDILLGIWLLWGRYQSLANILQLLAVAAYTLFISCTIPHLWANPLAPIAKNLPILVLILIFMVIGKER
jgi:uncharacterized protein YbjT (DUF2867 family)